MRDLVRSPLTASAALFLAICPVISACTASAIAPPSQAPGHPVAASRGAGPPRAVTSERSSASSTRRSLPAPPSRREPGAAPVMMVLGDSFTVGSGPVPAWRAYACQAARLLGWQPVVAGAGGTGYLNRGRAGRTFQQSYEQELAWRPAPDVLVVSGGHNDQRWSTAQVGRAATRLVREARAGWPATRIVVVGPLWLEAVPDKALRIRDTLAAVARREGVEFLDPLRRRWVTGDPSAVVLPDGVHPTSAGHLMLARWLARSLRS
ncbi:SGNH/GDSL hydrolase family protein [Nonomuraea roseoviolacea]|nr:SGNH/GDSL hydrolase family protein [Nonomuraea roseoviolacea]